MAPRPTTTSYAVLGLLALRPFTAYELEQQVERSLRWLWPTSTRTLYKEPARLEAFGWVTSERVGADGRGATRHHITDAGRAALDAWLHSPVAPPMVGNEALLRLMFADQAGPAELLASLDGAVSGWRDHVQAAADVAGDYLDGTGPYPERAHLVALLCRFAAEVEDVLADFRDEVADLVATWGTTTGVGARPEVLEMLRTAVARAGAGGRPPDGTAGLR